MSKDIEEALFEDSAALGAPANIAESRWVSRSYRIFAGGQPLMQVTERFPVAMLD